MCIYPCVYHHLCFLQEGWWRGGSGNVAVDTMIAFATSLTRGTDSTVSKNAARGGVCNCRFM